MNGRNIDVETIDVFWQPLKTHLGISNKFHLISPEINTSMEIVMKHNKEMKRKK